MESTRGMRIGFGLFAVAAGAALFVSLFWAFRDALLGMGDFGGPLFLGLRILSFAVIAWGAWFAYRHWKQI